MASSLVTLSSVVHFLAQCGLVFLLLANSLASARPVPVPFDLVDWVKGQLHPEKGTTLHEEIMCYNLPYGGIGFLSHCLTYYTYIMLGLNREPLLPWKRLKKSFWNFLITLISLLATVPLTALTISACRNRWQFLVIGVWKLTLSFTLNVMPVHHNIRLMRSVKYSLVGDVALPRPAALGWLILYFLGTLVGMAGLCDLVRQTYPEIKDVRTITLVFGCLAFVPAAVGVVWFLGTCACCCFSSKKGDRIGTAVGVFFVSGGIAAALFGALAAFYSDWILAAIAGNWVGTPSSDNTVLFWAYFVAKRLPLLSF